MEMKKILENPVINLVARIILGVVLIAAASSKVVDPRAFANEIANYQVMFREGLNVMALILPWLEMLIGITLILGIRLKASAVIAAMLMTVFIAAVLSAMARGLDISCGCFGPNSEKVGWNKVLENTGLLILAIYIWLYPVKTLTVERFFSKKKD